MSQYVYIRGKSVEPRFALTEEQLKNMIHMTGIERTRKIGGGYFRSYRNYYWAGSVKAELEDLVSKGLATAHKVPNPDKLDVVYNLTESGYLELSAHLKRNIRIDD